MYNARFNILCCDVGWYDQAFANGLRLNNIYGFYFDRRLLTENHPGATNTSRQYSTPGQR